VTAMSLAIAARMTSADLLKLRKRRGAVIWALVLALAPLLIYFIVRAVQHSSNPVKYEAAGGAHGYPDALRLIALFFGPLAAILIGVDAGAGDSAAGVFRDLVVTGRSRIALFASRVPAALGLTWIVIGIGYAVAAIGTYALASGAPTPSATLMLEGLAFTLLSTGTICAVAVGLSSLTASRPTALTVLIGWQLVASPLLAAIGSLGKSRDLVLSQALVHFAPVKFDEGRHGASVVMGGGTAALVIVVWLVVFLALGAWRTRTMDA
jgi:ABC-type transport system involved in multi-copper enzyme maturation permease subunit